MDKINAFTEATNNEVKRFHNSRRLFVIIDDVVYSEKRPSGLNHNEWFKTLQPKLDYDTKYEDINYIINNCVRGYYYDNYITMYQGVNFKLPVSVVEQLDRNLLNIAMSLDLHSDTEICIGVSPCKLPIFPVKYKLGKLEHLLKLEDFSKIYKLVEK